MSNGFRPNIVEFPGGLVIEAPKPRNLKSIVLIGKGTRVVFKKESYEIKEKKTLYWILYIGTFIYVSLEL